MPEESEKEGLVVIHHKKQERETWRISAVKVPAWPQGTAMLCAPEGWDTARTTPALIHTLRAVSCLQAQRNNF